MTYRNDGTVTLYFKGQSVEPGGTITLGTEWEAYAARFTAQGILTETVEAAPRIRPIMPRDEPIVEPVVEENHDV